jgi:DNA-binding transcriptional regulator/RsmH inhibitor MraZ
MKTTIVDKGWVYIPKKFQEKLSRHMFIVDTQHGLLLVPAPDDPVAEIEKIGEKLPAITIKELKAEIMKQAVEELRKM